MKTADVFCFLAAQNLCPVFVFLDDTSMTFMAFDKEYTDLLSISF